MKGKVETTIPQRQFENIRISYEFGTEAEKKEAIENVIKDCVDYHHVVSKKIVAAEKTAVVETTVVSGVEWRLQESGNWAYFDKKDKQWISSSTPPLNKGE